MAQTTHEITAHKENTEINIHKIKACSKGIAPTDCRTFFDKPAPIKKSVSVSPAFAMLTM